MNLEPENQPEPQAPHPDECCGRGCVPCIFDYYELQLQKWRQMSGSYPADSDS